MSIIQQQISMNWPEYFCGILDQIAAKSKDPRTKVGAIIAGPDNEIRSTGFNGFPRGVDETKTSRWERPEKYKWVAHADRNAIDQAARVGTPCRGCTMYLPFPPCSECAKSIIQVGIVVVICQDIYRGGNPELHLEELKYTKAMFKESNVSLWYLDELRSKPPLPHERMIT